MMLCRAASYAAARIFAVVVYSSAAMSGGCSRTVEEAPVLIEHRVDGCRQWCEWWTDPACPVDSPDGHRPDLEECFNGCATHDGKWSAGWGYVEGTEQDACVAEWTAHKDCARAMTCDEKQIYFSEEYSRLGKDAPCYSAWEAMSICEIEHN